MFNINKALKESGLSKTEIIRLQLDIRKDYPDDDMLYELHLIRALKTLKTKPTSRRSRTLSK